MRNGWEEWEVLGELNVKDELVLHWLLGRHREPQHVIHRLL